MFAFRMSSTEWRQKAFLSLWQRGAEGPDVSETPSEMEACSSGPFLGTSPGEEGHFQEQEQLKKRREPLSSLGCPRGSGIVAPKCQISDHDSKPLTPSPPHASAGICSQTLAGGGWAGPIFCLAWLWPPNLPVYAITLSSSVTREINI